MKSRIKNAALTLLAVATLAAAPLAHAQLIVNGDFETGDYTGWNFHGNTGFSAILPDAAYSGNFGWYDGAVGSLGLLSQTIATTPGQQYAISFWYHSSGGQTNELAASFNGVSLIEQYNLPALGWQQLTFLGTATTSSTDLTLGLRDDPAFSFIDNVSVSQVGAPVPEPSTYGLVGAGVLVGLAVLRRRKRSAA